MKKFYCNGKIVYLHNRHTEQSAKYLLTLLGVAGRCDNVCQALDKDQDLLECYALGIAEAAFMHTCDEEYCTEDLDRFLTDTPTEEGFDHYEVPNGKSAPYGLTGVEVAALKEDDTIYVVDLLFSEGVRKYQKIMLSADTQLVATDRDLVFSDRSKAVQAYNALFGDLYGTV
jgi:hypothetical protein